MGTSLSIPPSLEEEFDVVVVGGGSTGCVVAARLAEGGARVLLLEAGPSNQERGIRRRVGSPFLQSVQLQTSELSCVYSTVPQEAAGGRASRWPRGKLLGGCSSVNQCLYVRGDPRTFDDWETRLGCQGWGWKSVLKHFKKCEHYHGDGNPALRGFDGPIQVTKAEKRFGLATREVCELFLAACEAAGIPRVEDYNGETQTGASVIQATVCQGVRSDAASAYLFDATRAARLASLRIVTGACAERIQLEELRARGVHFRLKGELKYVRAKETVVCAGAIGSPQLLMLSGIGPKEHLEAVGLECQADLAVGSNLCDHLCFPLRFSWREPLAFNPARQTSTLISRAQHALGKGGVYDFPPVGALCFCQSKVAESYQDLDPDIPHDPASEQYMREYVRRANMDRVGFWGRTRTLYVRWTPFT
ncbi:unnamed protein product [Effrenium voratum]|nr:unnamed protein product [Effrenium voratum]